MDPIERQKAIDTVRRCSVKEVTPAYMLIDRAEAMIALMRLPSVQPEIIHCKDCRFLIDEGDGYYMCGNSKGWVVGTDAEFGCVLAERRTDD